MAPNESKESASEDSITQKETEESMVKGCIETIACKDAVELELEMRLGYFGLGLHDRIEVPEADKLLEVVGQIEGRTARILLDTGCSTYVLSSSFAEQNGIHGIPMRAQPVDPECPSRTRHGRWSSESEKQ